MRENLNASWRFGITSAVSLQIIHRPLRMGWPPSE